MTAGSAGELALGEPGTSRPITLDRPATMTLPTLRARRDVIVQVDTAVQVNALIIEENAVVLVGSGSLTATSCTIDPTGSVTLVVCP